MKAYLYYKCNNCQQVYKSEERHYRVYDEEDLKQLVQTHAGKTSVHFCGNSKQLASVSHFTCLKVED